MAACGLLRAENWPGWRGPEGIGECREAGFPTQWDARRNVRWRVALPDRGNSTPVVWGDRIFLTQAIEKEHRRTVMCFARGDGRVLWQAGVTWDEAEPTNGQNPYCSSSPVTDGRRVVAYFGSAGLCCYDFDGRELWRRDLGKVDSWQGSGSSPVLYGDLCIVNAGPGTHATLVACDARTGEVAWKAAPPEVGGRGAAAGVTRPAGGSFDDAINQADPTGAGGFLGSWSTPIVVRVNGHDELIVVHPRQVTGYEPATGRELWTCRGLPEQAFASPALGGDVLVATGHRLDGGGTRVTAVRLGGKGDVTDSRRLWQTDLPKECVGSGVVAGNEVYLVTQFGTAVCLDLSSGKKIYEKRLPGRAARAGSWSSPVLADGKLLVPNHSGEVFVLAASPHFQVLETNDVGEETTCASLAISDGDVFLRTYKALWCFGRTAEPGK